MKTSLAVILFLVLSIRPAYYLGQVVYYGLNIDYIIQTYCVNKDQPEMQCNGKCHLAKQLQATSSETGNELQGLAIVEGFFPIFNQIQNYDLPKPYMVFDVRHSIWDGYESNYHYLLTFSSFKPPKHII